MRFRNYLTLEGSSHDIWVINLRDSHAKYVRVTGDKVHSKEMQLAFEESSKSRL
jgi:hypothetical protein